MKECAPLIQLAPLVKSARVARAQEKAQKAGASWDLFLQGRSQRHHSPLTSYSEFGRQQSTKRTYQSKNQQSNHISARSKQALAFWRTTTRQAFIKASFLQAKQLAGLHGISVWVKKKWREMGKSV
jgi:hypothetical protein